MRLHLSRSSQKDPSTFNKQTPKSNHAVLYLLLDLGMRRSLFLRAPLMTPTYIRSSIALCRKDLST